MRVYMDNSATSFPKPPEMVQAMVDYMTLAGTSVSRSTSSEASETGDLLFQLREELAEFFQGEDSRNVIFTKNITEALNIVISGMVSPGDRIMISSLEHNAVTRPLTAAGAEILPIPVSESGILDLSFVKDHIGSVKGVFCTHVSNVSGDVLPIEEIARLSQEKGIPFILDTAQSAGILPLSMKKIPIDCLCFTGHKGLLGPTGTGGMVLSTELGKLLPPFITGGTGSRSSDEIHPMILPDKFEAGTPNVVGLIGLLASLRFINKIGIPEIFRQETALGTGFFQRLSSLKGFDIIGSKDYGNKPPVFSLNFHEMDNAEVSYTLSSKYHIDNRCGLHCSPRAHQAYGTYPVGTVRLSLSHYTTEQELDYVANAISEILQK